MARVREGTRDYCRNCGAVISYQREPRDESRHRPRHIWVHLVEDAEPRQTCPGLEHITQEGEEAGSVNFWRSPKAQPKSYCMESMQNASSWYSEFCLRPVKDYDLYMCGIHASRARKEAERQEKERQAKEQEAYLAEVLRKVIAHIEEQYDLKSDADYSRWPGHGPWHPPRLTGKIVVDPQELLETLDGLRDEESF